MTDNEMNNMEEDIIIFEDISTDLVWIVCQVPKVSNEFIRMGNALNGEAFTRVCFFAMLLYA